MFIDKLAIASHYLSRFKVLSWCVWMILLGVIGYSLAFISSDEQYLYALPSLLACIWMLTFNLLIAFFKKTPSNDYQHLSLLSRWKIKLQRLIYWLLGLIFIVLSLSLFILTIRSFNLWRGGIN